jgi:hypothetical protein
MPAKEQNQQPTTNQDSENLKKEYKPLKNERKV